MVASDRVLANGVRVLVEDVWIWEVYDFCCVIHPDRLARALHEEPPKSLNPHWRSMPVTRYPVCYDCHALVHNLPRLDAAFMLEHARTSNYPDAVRRIENGSV